MSRVMSQSMMIAAAAGNALSGYAKRAEPIPLATRSWSVTADCIVRRGL